MRGGDCIWIGSIVVGFLLLVLFVGGPSYTGYAVYSDKDIEYYVNNLDEFKEEYNNNVENVPGFVKKMYGGERIDLSLKMEDGSKKKIVVITSDGKIINISNGVLDDPSLIIETSEDVVADIVNSEDSVGALKRSLKDGSVDYKSVGFFTKIKMFFGRVALTVSSWF